jgi:hypothetical protein
MSTKTKQKESTMSIQNRQFVQRIQGLPSAANTNITSNNYSYLSEAPGGSGGGGSGGTGGTESGRQAIKKVMENFGTPGPDGDYNGDGVVDVNDILWVLEHWDDFNNPVPAGEPESAGGKPSFASIQNRMPGKPSIGMPESTQRPTGAQLTEAIKVITYYLNEMGAGGGMASAPTGANPASAKGVGNPNPINPQDVVPEDVPPYNDGVNPFEEGTPEWQNWQDYYHGSDKPWTPLPTVRDD